MDKKVSIEFSVSDKIEILKNPEYLDSIYKKLKALRITTKLHVKQLKIMLMTLGVSIIGWFFIKDWTIIILIVGVGVAYYHRIKESIITEQEIKQYQLDYIRSQINLDIKFSNTLGLNRYEMEDLIDKEFDKISYDKDNIVVKDERNEFYMLKNTRFIKIYEDEKGRKLERTIFNGSIFVLPFDKALVSSLNEDKTGIQIKPISKLGRLVQDTISSYSKSVFHDIPFSNEELNDVMKMQIERGLLDIDKSKDDLEEELLKLLTTTLEEVFYQINLKYGSFYLKIKNKKLLLAIDKGGLVGKGFLTAYFPTNRCSDYEFSIEKWFHFFYMIGCLQAMRYHIHTFLGINTSLGKEIANEASVYNYLVMNSDLPDKEEINAYNQEFKSRTDLPLFVSDEFINLIKEDL